MKTRNSSSAVDYCVVVIIWGYRSESGVRSCSLHWIRLEWSQTGVHTQRDCVCVLSGGYVLRESPSCDLVASRSWHGSQRV